MIPSRENKHEWWVGRYNQWDPWGPWLCLLQRCLNHKTKDERCSTRKVFNFFWWKSLQIPTALGFCLGGSQRVHTVEHTIFVWFPFCCLKKICMHIAYRNRNRDLIYCVSGHFGFAIAHTIRRTKFQRCSWNSWWANERMIIFTSKWSEKKVATWWGWLAPTSAESQLEVLSLPFLR